MIGSFLRKLRGIVGTGLSWAFYWSILGTALQWSLAVLGLARPVDLSATPLMSASMGFYGGCVFGGVLSLTERRRSPGELHLGRGAVGGGRGRFTGSSSLRTDARWPQSLGDPALWLQSWAIIVPLGALSTVGMTEIAHYVSIPTAGV